ncbi:DUF7109 family protein [Halopenitus persicus]|uniref:DUF7109 family protein n=1 Tax=Halopenitus persicus TaxID=1048396 RepID=UPI001E5BA63A|nr:hypothetical protein [Halopenitus persicus]
MTDAPETDDPEAAASEAADSGTADSGTADSGTADSGTADSGTDDAGVAARDDLAGIVDLFGAMTRPELRRGLSELAFKRGVDVDDGTLRATIDAAVRGYHLVPVEGTDAGVDPADETFLVAGPAAFPSVPPNAEDLPHILDVPDRRLEREALGRTVRDRLATDVADAVASADRSRLEELLEVTYDLETWAPVDGDDLRGRIRATLDGLGEDADG